MAILVSNSSRPILLALALPIAGCARPAPIPEPVPPAPANTVAETDTVLRGWAASDSAAMALQLSVLRHTPLPSGSREIRIWTGLALGVPHDLLRLSEREGRVDGSLGWHWSARHDPEDDPTEVPIDAVVRRSVAGRCTKPRRVGETEACRVHLRAAPNWRALWDSLENLGVWRLPDQDELPQIGASLDGWGMTVELRDGQRYRSYAYDNPDGHRHPAQVAATAVARIGDDLWRLVPPSVHQRRLRGRLAIKPGEWSEFRGCGSNISWGVSGRLTPTLDSLRARKVGSDSVAGVFYVEALASLAYPGLARSWGTPYPEVLEVDSILTVAAWEKHPC